MRTARLPTLRVLVASVAVGSVPTPLAGPMSGVGVPTHLNILTLLPCGILTSHGHTHPFWDTHTLDKITPMGYSPPAYSPTGIFNPWTYLQIITHLPHGIRTPDHTSGKNDWHCWKAYLHATTVAGGKYLGQNHVLNRRQTRCSSSHIRRRMTANRAMH